MTSETSRTELLQAATVGSLVTPGFGGRVYFPTGQGFGLDQGIGHSLLCEVDSQPARAPTRGTHKNRVILNAGDLPHFPTSIHLSETQESATH